MEWCDAEQSTGMGSQEPASYLFGPSCFLMEAWVDHRIRTAKPLRIKWKKRVSRC